MIAKPVIVIPRGFTLIEVLISVAIGSMILASMTTVLYTLEKSSRETQSELALQRNASFALDRMVRAVEAAKFGFIPLGENTATAHQESVRSILAVSMDPTLDRDHNGWSDANNDHDWQDYNNDGIRDPGEPERIDEDPGHDLSNDGVAGLIGIDDDGDGQVDELMVFDDPLKSHEDDDEDGWKNDDNVNGQDDDNDGSIDEDVKQEINDDDAPGLANYDDNFDGLIDTHPSYPGGDGTSKEAKRDDDEDGAWNEDGPEAVVYYLGATEVYANSSNGIPIGPALGNANVLYERLAEADAVDGTAFASRVIATDVETFQVKRLPTLAAETPLFEISLTVHNEQNQKLTVSRTARLGARR